MFPFVKKDKKPLKSIKEILNKIEGLEHKIEIISEELVKREKESRTFFQKCGLKRYNPFNELGGDQSFSIALLDKFNNGFVITSIFTEGGSRIFSKAVKNGESEYKLSKDEKEVIEIAKENYGQQ